MRDSVASVGKGPTTDDSMPTTATELVEWFRGMAERSDPEPVDQEIFRKFLDCLRRKSKVILSMNSFYNFLEEREEVNKFYALRTALDRKDYHVRGDQTGNFVVYLYYLGDKPWYVEVEWVPGFGYVYDEVKVFKIEENFSLPAYGKVRM